MKTLVATSEPMSGARRSAYARLRMVINEASKLLRERR